jgi:hypothetical protein
MFTQQAQGKTPSHPAGAKGPDLSYVPLESPGEGLSHIQWLLVPQPWHHLCLPSGTWRQYSAVSLTTETVAAATISPSAMRAHLCEAQRHTPLEAYVHCKVTLLS